MRNTHTSSAVKRRYNDKAYDRIVITVKKGNAQQLSEYAASRGESRNAFILRAIEEKMQRDKEKDTN